MAVQYLEDKNAENVKARRTNRGTLYVFSLHCLEQKVDHLLEESA